MVRGRQGGKLKATSVEIRKVGFFVDPFAVRFLHCAQERMFQSFAHTALATAVRPVEENDSALKIQDLGRAKAPEWPERQVPKPTPRPAGNLTLGCKLGRRIGSGYQRLSCLLDEVDGSLIMLASLTCHFIE